MQTLQAQKRLPEGSLKKTDRESLRLWHPQGRQAALS